MTYLKNIICSLRGDEAGVTLVEYGIAIGLAVAIGAPTLFILGNAISNSMGAAGNQMP